MIKKIICDIDYAGGEHFPVGETKNKLWELLDNKLVKGEDVHITLNSPLQLLAVDYYATKNNCVLEVKIPTETNGFKVVSGENLCEAHYYLNKEYIDLENEFSKFEIELEEQNEKNKKELK